MEHIEARRANVSGEFLFKGSTDGVNYVFEIPDYQRPYVWKKEHCQALFSDIIDNDLGYFVGAIIVWGQNKAFQQYYNTLEVVDGQQRLTTLTIFLAAIYEAINIRKGALKEKLGEDKFNDFGKDDDRSSRFDQIPRSLTLKTSQGKLRTRVMPHNEDDIQDYLNIMIQTGLLTRDNVDYSSLKEKGADKRHRITKAYFYFRESIAKYANGEAGQYKDDIAKQLIQIMELLKKVNSALVVMIEANSLSSANTLFESLNARGEPLTINDLIKNKLFAALKEKMPNDYDDCRKVWDSMIENKLIRPNGKEISAGEQERFFRHSYNACRTGWNKDYPNSPFAEGKRANLYDSYVKMIGLDPERVFKQITSCAKSYLVIQGLESKGSSSKSKLHKLYKDLNRINGATSYTLLLYLVRNRKELGLLSDNDFEKICQLLINFFVRHSFTDIPLANKLDSIFIKFIDKIEEHSYTGATIYKELSLWLKDAYRADDNDKIFISKLCGDVYERGSTNRAIKFVLIKLAEKYLLEHEIKDTNWDKWSIEHVLPQTVKSDNKWGKAWIEMLSGGVIVKAQEIQKENVNKLGNLTLTPAPYNAEQSNRPFMDKRTRKNGYDKSILNSGLNSYICKTDIWGKEQIQARTNALLEDIIEIFAW